MEFLFWVSMELYIPKITKMTSFFLMHNLITESTPAAPWRRRNAGLVRASRFSFGWVPGARAVQLAQPNSGQKWRFWWLRPRALTQNDSRTPRKLVDEDRTAVGRVRMQVGRGSRCHPIRITYIFRGFESRSSFWRHRPTAGCARARATSSSRTPPPARARPRSGPRGATRARARGRARARRERRGGALGSGGSDLDDDIVDLDAAAAEPLPPPLSPPPTRACTPRVVVRLELGARRGVARAATGGAAAAAAAAAPRAAAARAPGLISSSKKAGS